MKLNLKIIFIINILISHIVACNKPQLDLINNKKTIDPETVIIRLANKQRYLLEILVDGIYVPIVNNQNKKQKFNTVKIFGLKAGKHHFVVLSPNAIFGPDQFDIDLNASTVVEKILFSKKFKFNLDKIIKEAMPSVSESKIYGYGIK